MSKDDLPATRASQVPVFSANNNLTIADILSVAVGEAEAKLQKILKEEMAKYKAIEERIKQIGKDLETQTDALQVSCGLQEDIDVANKILNKLFETTIGVKVEIDKKKKVVAYCYGCMHTHGAKRVPFTPEIIRLTDLLDVEQESLDKARTDVAETRKRLANIPALERRYRGKLVASQLEKSAEGKSVMAVITANMEEELRNI